MLPLIKQGIRPNNIELNEKLASNIPLTGDDKNMIRFLDLALEKLPPQSGEFVRIASYDVPTTPWDSVLPITPWDTSFKIGDIVTNYPCYMSVASSQNFMCGHYDPKVAESTVIYRFDNTHSSKPLLMGYATTLPEHENLFRRNSVFKVKHIALVQDVKPTFEASEFVIEIEESIKKNRVVILEETEIPQNREAKNIYNGKKVTIDL